MAHPRALSRHRDQADGDALSFCALAFNWSVNFVRTAAFSEGTLGSTGQACLLCDTSV